MVGVFSMYRTYRGAGSARVARARARARASARDFVVLSLGPNNAIYAHSLFSKSAISALTLQTKTAPYMALDAEVPVWRLLLETCSSTNQAPGRVAPRRRVTVAPWIAVVGSEVVAAEWLSLLLYSRSVGT